MKCPNCSFQNSDDSIACKVCGFELPRPVKTPKEHSENPPPTQRKDLPRKRLMDDEDDKALDDVMKSLFGHDQSDRVIDEDDALDAAMMEKLLKKKRIQQQKAPVAPTEPSTEKPASAAADKHASTDKPQYNIRIILSAAAIVLVMFLLLKTGFSKSFWRYDSGDSTTEPVTVASTETLTEPTTEVAFSLGDDAILEPINLFFRGLPDFVNKGNLNVLTLFSNSQDALEVLSAFASIGNLEKISSTKIDSIDLYEDGGAYTITTALNRLISGQQTETSAIWDFKVLKTSNGYVIESLGIDTDDLEVAIESTTSTTQPTTIKPTESTTKPITTETSTEATTEEPVALDGFIDKGGFTGGVLASGQDIAAARFGHNIGFDRIVFDLYEWKGGQPTDSAETVTQYATSISEDKKSIKITFTGALDAYAKNSALDLKGYQSVQSVSYDVSGSTESVVVTINLSAASVYKVINVKSPARLIVDFAPTD